MEGRGTEDFNMHKRNVIHKQADIQCVPYFQTQYRLKKQI